jgi:hypothetical protein
VTRVTEEAKMLLSSVDLGTLDSAEGTILRLDPLAYDGVTGEITLSFASGDGKSNEQIIQHWAKQVLRIAGAVSQRLNGSTIDVVVEEGPEGTRMGIIPMPTRVPSRSPTTRRPEHRGAPSTLASSPNGLEKARGW